MRAQRHLVLRKETLAELRTAELAAIGGGAQELPRTIVCFDVARPSGNLPICASVFEPCTYGCVG